MLGAENFRKGFRAVGAAESGDADAVNVKVSTELGEVNENGGLAAGLLNENGAGAGTFGMPNENGAGGGAFEMPNENGADGVAETALLFGAVLPSAVLGFSAFAMLAPSTQTRHRRLPLRSSCLFEKSSLLLSVAHAAQMGIFRTRFSYREAPLASGKILAMRMITPAGFIATQSLARRNRHRSGSRIGAVDHVVCACGRVPYAGQASVCCTTPALRWRK